MSIWVIFTLLGSLALLMFGMKTMSEALQKMAGPQLRHVLGAMTTNRFTGMLTGTLVTASVQSSTATTVMTVSFVNCGVSEPRTACSFLGRKPSCEASLGKSRPGQSSLAPANLPDQASVQSWSSAVLEAHSAPAK